MMGHIRSGSLHHEVVPTCPSYRSIARLPGLWGVFYFREIDVRTTLALAGLFFSAAAVAVGGSVLLLLSGSQ